MRCWRCSGPVHPHVRGVNEVECVVGGVRVRFIPTCVGLISRSEFNGLVQPVYPHVRGVNDSVRSLGVI